MRQRIFKFRFSEIVGTTFHFTLPITVNIQLPEFPNVVFMSLLPFWAITRVIFDLTEIHSTCVDNWLANEKKSARFFFLGNGSKNRYDLLILSLALSWLLLPDLARKWVLACAYACARSPSGLSSKSDFRLFRRNMVNGGAPFEDYTWVGQF